MVDMQKLRTQTEKALCKWGSDAQLRMLVEEMAELQKEILKYVDRYKWDEDKIREETVDVFMNLQTSILRFGWDNETYEKKVKYLEEKLKGD